MADHDEAAAEAPEIEATEEEVPEFWSTLLLINIEEATVEDRAALNDLLKAAACTHRAIRPFDEQRISVSGREIKLEVRAEVIHMVLDVPVMPDSQGDNVATFAVLRTIRQQNLCTLQQIMTACPGAEEDAYRDILEQLVSEGYITEDSQIEAWSASPKGRILDQVARGPATLDSLTATMDVPAPQIEKILGVLVEAEVLKLMSDNGVFTWALAID